MRCYLKNSAYYEAIRDDASIDKKEEYFSQHFANNPQYHFGNVSHDDFSRFYNSDGWIGRKITAIPLALWSGLIKTIYHLAKMVLGLITKPFTSHGFGVQENFFRARRDLQESFGRVSALFNDQYGSYHIQESIFHSQCYDCFGAVPSKLFDPYVDREPGRWDESMKVADEDVPLKSVYIRLKQVKNEFLDDSEAAIKKFRLQDRVESFEKEYGMSVAEVLKRIPNNRLETARNAISLSDVFLPRGKSKITLALLSDKELFKMTFPHYATLEYGQQLYVDDLFIEYKPKKSTKVPDFDNLTLQDLSEMDASVIQKHLAKIPAEVFTVFNKEQMSGIKLSDLTKDQINGLFSMYFFRSQKIEWFEDSDILDAVHTQHLDGENCYGLNEFPARLCPKLKLQLLNQSQSKKIFGDYQDANNACLGELLEAISIDDIILGIKKGGITQKLYRMLPDDKKEHFHSKPLSTLDTKVVDHMFFSGNIYDAKERFAKISVEEIQRAIESGSLTEEQKIFLISDQQKEDLEKLVEAIKYKKAEQQISEML